MVWLALATYKGNVIEETGPTVANCSPSYRVCFTKASSSSFILTEDSSLLRQLTKEGQTAHSTRQRKNAKEGPLGSSWTPWEHSCAASSYRG